MSKIKAEFQKPKLMLYSMNYSPLGVLTNKTQTSAYNIVLNKSVNETPILSFNMPMGGLLNINSTELLVKHKNDYYVIKDISLSDAESSTLKIQAEHTACELKGIIVGYFEEMIGETPNNMWDTIINSTSSSMATILKDKYIFDTNIINTYRYLESEEEKSVFEYLMTIAERFDSCLIFSTDDNGKIHIELLHGEIDRGKFVRKGRDLKQLNLSFSTESLFTKMTPFGGTDDNGIEVNILGVSDNSYICNYDYYLAKGMDIEEIKSNPLCNQECVYRNSDILDANELLKEAMEELKRMSVPTIDGSIDMIDLNVFEGSIYSSPMLCERILVIDKDINYSISCRVTAIEFSYENPLESKITVSNVVQYNSKIKELFQNGEKLEKILTNGDYGKPNLDASKVRGYIDGHIARLKYSMEDSIDEVVDAVILFEDKDVNSDTYGALAIGSRGILISQVLDGTTGKWAWTTALDATGLSTNIINAMEINGSQIRGDIITALSGNTWINLNDGTFNFDDKIKLTKDGFSIDLSNNKTINDLESMYQESNERIQSEINDINGALERLEGDIGEAIGDGIITKAELIIIQESIKQLDTEMKDVSSRYTELMQSDDVKIRDYLDNDIKNDLSYMFTEYCVKHNALCNSINNMVSDWKATTQERQDYESKLSEYRTTLGNLSAKFDEAIKNISQNYANYKVNDLSNAINKDVKDIDDKLNDFIDNAEVALSDGLLDKAERMMLVKSKDELDKEKKDLGKILQSLKEDSNLTGTTVLSNVQNAYNSYSTSHTNLINYINFIILQTKVTDDIRNQLVTLTDTYSTALANFKYYATMATSISAKNYTTVQFDILEESIETKISGEEFLEYRTFVDNSFKTVNDKEKDLSEQIASIEDLTNDMKVQIDGKIETFYQNEDPSLRWTTDELIITHNGDIWYNPSVNKTYRWGKENNFSSKYTWLTLTDKDAIEAKSLATSKAKVFISTPTPPYNIGDLWITGSSSAPGDILRCATASTTTYNRNHWVNASKYTDDTTANNVANNLSNNYYTSVQCDAQISNTKKAIEESFSKTYVTNTALGNTIKDYVKTADYSRDSERWEAKFTLQGFNLLLNGRPRTHTNHWMLTWSQGSSGSKSLSTGGCNWNGEYFYGGIWWEGTRKHNSGGTWCCLFNTSLSNYRFNTQTQYSISMIIFNGSKDSNGNYVNKNIDFAICDTNGQNSVTWNSRTVKTGYQYINIDFVPERSGYNPSFGMYLISDGDFSFYIPWVVIKEGGYVKTWTPNSDEIESGKTTIDKDGVTVTNGALTIKNNNNENVFYADDSGNLTLQGTVINGKNGYNTVLNKGGLMFTTEGESVGVIRSTRFTDNKSINGVTIANLNQGDYIDLGYTSGTNIDTPNDFYATLRISKTDAQICGGFKGIQLKGETQLDLGRALYLQSVSGTPAELFTDTESKVCLYGDDGISLGYKNGTSMTPSFQITKTSGSTGSQIWLYKRTNAAGISMSGSLNMQNHNIENIGNIGQVDKFALRISDLNSYLKSGWYCFGEGSNHAPCNWGILLQFRAFSTDMCQIVFSTGNIMYIRWWVNGAYTSWRSL